MPDKSFECSSPVVLEKNESTGNGINARHIYSVTLMRSGRPVSTCRRSVSLKPIKPTSAQVIPKEMKSMPVDFITIWPVTPAITKSNPMTMVILRPYQFVNLSPDHLP